MTLLPPSAPSLSLRLVGRWLLMLGVVFALFAAGRLAVHLDELQEHEVAFSSALQSDLRADSIREDAAKFLASVSPNSRVVQLRIEDGIEIPVVPTPHVTRLTLPVTAGDSAGCAMTVAAWADISLEAIRMRPEALSCAGRDRVVKGAVRALDGRLLDAQVHVERSWLFGLPTFSLRLPPYTTVQAWLEQ